MSSGSESGGPSGLGGLTALVLAGGAGSRLRPVLSDRPKVLAEVAGRPFLAYLLEALAAAGLRHVVLCTGHLGEQIKSCFGDAFKGLALAYSHEREALDTGGALRLALPLIACDTALVANGDSFCAADLAAFLDFHRSRRAAASLVATKISDSGRFGSLEIEADGRVRRFAEKAASDGQEGLINAGIYLIERRLIAAIPKGRPISLERQLFDQWLATGLYAWPCQAPFLDIGTPQSYAQAEDFFAQQSIQAQQ